MANQRVVVVGGGLAGLSATARICEEGIPVDLVSMVPVKRSHSVCAQGGINSCNHLTRQQGDSEWRHLDDTVYGGDFLQNQPPVKEMCDWAPRIIDLLDRMGVMFNRTAEGFLDFRRFGGTLFKRTAFSGATTGQQLIYALDEQVRRHEADGLVKKYEFWEFLGPIVDGQGVCRGVVVQNMFDMNIHALPADAVVLATGGCGLIFGKSTMSMICTGGANSRAYQAGVRYANGEFVQVHPTAIPGADKHRLMSESARGEGGRVWVPRSPGDSRDPKSIPESERFYFLEEKYPEYGNLVPRDIATREIFHVCRDGYSVDANQYSVYLDLTHIPVAELDRKLAGILEIYEKFQGVDPRESPMKIFPAVHYSMGGLWVDYVKDESTGGLRLGEPRNQMTNIPGLFAAGECDYQYHGANRLGANALLSCIFSGLILGPGLVRYVRNLSSSAEDRGSLMNAEADRHKERYRALITQEGSENPYLLHRELGETMTRFATVIRDNKELETAESKILELQDRFSNVGLDDRGEWTNQSLSFARALGDMLPLALAIVVGARKRDECRGAHYKPDHQLTAPDSNDPERLQEQAKQYCLEFQARNDRWLKTTIASYTPEGPQFSYEPVDTSLIPPRPRTYGIKGGDVIVATWSQMQQTGGLTTGQYASASS
jgi:succinate dehydrogenase / fumarate reductase flavoprotein subunit